MTNKPNNKRIIPDGKLNIIKGKTPPKLDLLRNVPTAISTYEPVGPGILLQSEYISLNYLSVNQLSSVTNFYLNNFKCYDAPPND